MQCSKPSKKYNSTKIPTTKNKTKSKKLKKSYRKNQALKTLKHKK